MTTEPNSDIRRAGEQLVRCGADLVAGHSAHVFHGVQEGRQGAVLYDVGDFLDDYRADPLLRNDLGLLFLVDIADGRPQRLQAVPLKLEYCYTRRATGADARWITDRFQRACAVFGHDVSVIDGKPTITW